MGVQPPFAAELVFAFPLLGALQACASSDNARSTPDALATSSASDSVVSGSPSSGATSTSGMPLTANSAVASQGPTASMTSPASGASSAVNIPSAMMTGMPNSAPSSDGSAAPEVTASAASGVPSASSELTSGVPSSIPEVPGAGPVAQHGQLKVMGSEIQDEAGQPVILRGQVFGWDNWWPQYYNADVVNWLRDDWCVDMVRPAMGIEPDGAYLQDQSASRARIQTVVEAAVAKGIYVIIDWHAHDLLQAEAIAFFSDMAQTYGQYPNVICEVYNEPDEETWPEVKAYAEAVGAAIREHDPDNLIIVGSPEWDQRIDLVASDPITSLGNVVYSVHFYAATHGAWLRDRTASALAAGVAVLVSESSGSEAAGTGLNDYTEWQAWFDFMDQNNISWINYAVSDKAGETISVLESGAAASAGWDASQLTETGEYVREVFPRLLPVDCILGPAMAAGPSILLQRSHHADR